MFKTKTGKWSAVALLAVIIVAVGGYAYVMAAFPENRCEAKHLTDETKMAGDCYACHVKATPKIAQDWYEGKHGVLLVKCFVCHGQPDGKGAIEFAANPDPDTVCRKCHDPAVNRMQEKYGLRAQCNECHPYHQNSIHHEAFQKTQSKKTLD
ncbi:MAG: hypothetical protein H0S80_00770 [Desulfovibrionaceae bacterium]|nr:hypothetical protein [Desulfovibrionaceae bacterium]